MDQPGDVLRRLAKAARERFEPRPDPASPRGYAYPEVRAALGVPPGEEIGYLDRLAEQGFLERRCFERIRLCPFCAAGVLHVRLACPRCADLQVGGGPPGGDAYRCVPCGHVFSQPAHSFLCLVCARPFGIEQASAQAVYAYRLTDQAARAGAEAAGGERSPAPSAGAPGGDPPGSGAPDSGTEGDHFASVFVDTERVVYTLRFFEERINQEVARARRYGRSFSVMLASPHGIEAHAAAFGREATASLLKAVALVIKESIRDSDVPALYESQTLAFLLPETPLNGARTVAERIRCRVSDLSPAARAPRITLALGVAAHKNGSEDARQMIERAVRHMEEARQEGGDRVWSS